MRRQTLRHEHDGHDSSYLILSIYFSHLRQKPGYLRLSLQSIEGCSPFHRLIQTLAGVIHLQNVAPAAARVTEAEIQSVWLFLNFRCLYIGGHCLLLNCFGDAYKECKN